jgi:diaminopimelate decarboxylase
MWWANDFLNVKEGKLYLGDKESTKVAQTHGTPLFVYSKNQILSNFKTLLKAFAGKTSLEIRLYYAMKANPHQEILKILKETGACIDAVSPGEVAKALSAGFSADRIFFTGTSVSAEDLKLAFDQDDLIVNIDAEEQLELMKEIRERWFKHKKIKVAVRWNPGTGRGFNSKVVTAGEKTYDGMPIKFGVEEKRVIQTFARTSQYGFTPAGLHHHLGSGWTKQDFEAVKDAVDKMVQKASEAQRQGFPLEFLDFGGGFGPQYSSNQEKFPVKDYVEYICQKIRKSDLGIKTIAMEPGKYLVGDAGVLLVRVEYLKKSYSNLFACVNAGTFNTVPRPAIYSGAYHHIVNCSNVNSGKRKPL